VAQNPTASSPPDAALPSQTTPLAESAPLAAPATVSVPEPTQIPTVEQDHWYSLHKGRKFGLQLDIGGPDGGGLTALFRPFWWLKVNAGLAYNVMGAGIRGGLTAVPIRWAVTPTLNFDLGHYFSGDFTKFATPTNDAERALLQDTAYDFWSAQIGLEFGSQEGFVFYVRGGIAHLSATLPAKDVAAYWNTKNPSGTVDVKGDANFSALLPCFSLGLNYFIF
jgi:hypothetical protein